MQEGRRIRVPFVPTNYSHPALYVQPTERGRYDDIGDEECMMRSSGRSVLVYSRHLSPIIISTGS
jgi:hypothetical protein